MRGVTLHPPTVAGHFRRVIGTVDFLGQGTKHAVADVNPFVLLDDPPTMVGPVLLRSSFFFFSHKKVAAQRKAGLPPFGLHPHHGLHVCSIVWEGQLDSRTLPEPVFTTLTGPRAVSVFAGRGLAHDEHTHSDEPTTMQQLIWLVPEEARKKKSRVQVNQTGFFSVAPGAEVLVAIGKDRLNICKTSALTKKKKKKGTCLALTRALRRIRRSTFC